MPFGIAATPQYFPDETGSGGFVITVQWGKRAMLSSRRDIRAIIVLGVHGADLQHNGQRAATPLL